MKEDANASTEAALRRFQAVHDLPSTGVPDHETVRRLDLTRMTCFAERPRERIILSSVIASGASMSARNRNTLRNGVTVRDRMAGTKACWTLPCPHSP